MDLPYNERYVAAVGEITEKMQKSFSIDEEDMETYQMYIKNGKDAARQGNLSKALELFKSAYMIHSSEKLKSRMKKLEEALQEMERQESDGEDENFVNINNCGLMVFQELHDKLYDHQKEGIAFLYGLHRDGKKGGILADDMGLGKTIQIIAFLSGMYDSELVKHVLLIMPTSLLGNWTKEFAKWAPGMRVKEFHGSKAERNRNLVRIQRKGGVIITTYNMLLTNWELLSSNNGCEFQWDYVILDEAHKIKTSSTKTAKSAYAIPAKHRILLTGTPVQNNLSELWALFNFAFQGALLGTFKTFKSEYENPITRAREKDATPGEKALGLKISENLMTIINPYFMRRTKQEVQKKRQSHTNDMKSDLDVENKENKNPSAAGSEMPTLTRKNDLIVWTYLSTVQEDIYRQFISLEHIKELLMTSRSPLAELTVLKKLCDHPRLLSARAVAQLGLEEGINPREHHDENESAACQIDHVPDETLVSESGKLTFLVALLRRLREEGNRTLVFSQSRKMLDIIERILTNKGFKLVRIDGTVTHLPERERRIALFQANKQYTVFLLTTQVGGVGITLTAANRVVIFDPSWNPATDAQAVDRAYRIGQTANVVIYRLITCGTVEEKIYRRQVFKDSLIRQTTGDKKNPFRYFSQQQLKELFKLEDTRSSSTQLQLQSMHSRQRRTDHELDEHIAYLHSLEMFGISDHDLMFSHDAAVHEDHPEDQESHHYIENRVLKAHELMKAESELQSQFMENIASSTEPAYLRNPDIDTEGYTEDSWRSNTELESFKGNFNLQLEDSAEEMFQENKNCALVEEKQGLQLQMETSLSAERERSVKSACENFDVSVSTTENQSTHCVTDQDLPEEPSFIHNVKKKKPMLVIYDSEEEEENCNEDDGDLNLKSSFNEPLKGVECSTPKPVKTASFLLCSTPHRKSFGLNTSVASRRSLVESMIDDVEDLLEDMDAEDAEQSGSASESTGSHSESVMEEEEPTGKTLNTESEENGSQSVHTGEAELTDGESFLEESTSDYELASGESMEQCTQGQEQRDCAASTAVSKSAHVPEDQYESLLRTGKEYYSAGKLREALDSFLKAIDIRSGDPEIQLMTIQLYRQLSQH
ncbi:hypothetical protein SKAU_G00373870 [Synaphobranchus kaupii]|uniref:DNA excision repair protein ERCC-6-like n=1 Tax=Synaphobranchus kaupii TaxID=118154 RepID=A0A9Q1EGJ6_SYNKA|nr:hypothetical protein SKAU_G00373870 [Synaphobranchus kaupii]